MILSLLYLTVPLAILVLFLPSSRILLNPLPHADRKDKGVPTMSEANSYPSRRRKLGGLGAVLRSCRYMSTLNLKVQAFHFHHGHLPSPRSQIRHIVLFVIYAVLSFLAAVSSCRYHSRINITGDLFV